MKAKWFWCTLLFVSLVQVLCTVAFAFDLPPPALPTTDDQALGVANTLWRYIVEKKYAAAVGPALTLFVFGLKKYDLVVFNALRLPKVATAVDKFLDQPFVSFLLPTAISGVAGFVTALLSGHSVVDAAGAVWAASSTAITTYVGLKKAGEQVSALKPAAPPPAA